MKFKEIPIVISSGITISILFFTISLSFISAQQQGELNTIPKEKTNLLLSDLSVGKTDTGLIFVKGAVLNNSTHNVEDVKVDVRLFGTDNKLIKKDSRFVTPPSSILEAGSKVDFSFLEIAEDTHYYDVSSHGDRAQ